VVGQLLRDPEKANAGAIHDASEKSGVPSRIVVGCLRHGLLITTSAHDHADRVRYHQLPAEERQRR
jgi:hypothetical protein